MNRFFHPLRALKSAVGEGPSTAILILCGVNALNVADRNIMGVLLPEIRDSFHLKLSGVLALLSVVAVVSLALQVPIAYFADSTNRVRIAVIGALVWGVFSAGTGLATGLIFLAVVRSVSDVGKATVDPTHNLLIADYYDPDHRARVFSLHRASTAVGAFIGPIGAGILGHRYGWRVPFVVFAVPTVIMGIVAMRLREPVRGAHERRAMGASEDVINTEEDALSFAESWRTVWKIDSLRRIWYALPFLSVALIGFVSLAGLLYEKQFNLDDRARGFAIAATEPGQILGIIIGSRIATKLMMKDPGLVLKFLAWVAVVVAALSAGFALAPNLGIAIALNCLIAACLAVLGPGILASLSLAIPPRARSMGFSVASLWVIPGLIVLPLVGWIADNWGIRKGMLVLVPVFLFGGLVVSTAGKTLMTDITQVWTAAAARSEALFERRQGRSKLLLVRHLDVSYGPIQVLFDVDFEINEGEIIALLGTNGAGKSTLLKAISGVVEAHKGAVIFDGREITHAPPNEVAGRGIMQMPGGAGVFPSLTVGDNLRMASWTQRRDPAGVAAATAQVLEQFPVLAHRLNEPAANLSGGQQQMLALGMVFITRPRLVMIDELSLGLAPVVVDQLVPMVRQLAADGVTVIIVEQSVNLALMVAETAFFMEKGEIRFRGPTKDLLDRPDILRSVFLERAKPSQTFETMPVDRAAAPVLTVHEVGRSFGGIRAVDDVSFTLAPREILGVIGPNGAGKTTLFDLISGFTTSETGHVRLGANDISTLSPSGRAAKGLGRSFQDARLFPSLTVAETLAVALDRWVGNRSTFAAALYLPQVFDSEEAVALRVDELIELMGLGTFRNKFMRELSTGSRRIVDLACLVAHRPAVVLLDEPSSGIAQRETEALGPVLRRLRDEMGASLVVIEHDMALVTNVADRLLALDLGRLIADGPPLEVLKNPAVVDSYLGAHHATNTEDQHVASK